jgi:hypothetical protein
MLQNTKRRKKWYPTPLNLGHALAIVNRTLFLPTTHYRFGSNERPTAKVVGGVRVWRGTIPQRNIVQSSNNLKSLGNFRDFVEQSK